MKWMESDPQHRRILHNWQIFALVIAVLGELFLAGDWYGFAAVIPFVSKDLHLNAGEAGFAQGAFAITYSLGMFVWSPVGRRLAARWLFAVGLIGTGLFMALQAGVHDYSTLILYRLLIGFFDAAVWVATMKLIVGWFPMHRHGATMGILLAAFSLAITLDFAVGIPVSGAFGWRYFFLGLGCLTILVGLIGLAAIKGGLRDVGFADFSWNDGRATHDRHAPLSLVFRSKWLYVGGLAIFGDTFALAATATWVVPAFITIQGMPPASGATIGTLMGLSQIVFLLIGGWLSDRMRRTLMLQIGAFLAILSAVTFVAAVSWAMPWGMLLAIAAFSGVAVFSGGAIFSLISEKYGEELGATAIGFAELGGILSTLIAPWLLGVVIDATHSFTTAFVVFTLVEVAILVFLLIAARDSLAERQAAHSGATR